MFKKIVLSAALLVSSLGMAGGVSEAATPIKKHQKPVAIYYVPHQDDEFLSMGVSILNHRDAGYNIHLVLLTDGEGSKMIPRYNLTKAEFGAARDREFKLSANALRVPSSNLHYFNLPDGKVTKGRVKGIIANYEKMYPGARHIAYSYYDQHNDHKVSGQALRELYKQGTVDDVRFYINHGRYNTPGQWEYYKGRYGHRLKMASMAYKRYNPKWGYYGIGYKSAGDLFNKYQGKWKNKFHGPNQ